MSARKCCATVPDVDRQSDRGHTILKRLAHSARRVKSPGSEASLDQGWRSESLGAIYTLNRHNRWRGETSRCAAVYQRSEIPTLPQTARSFPKTMSNATAHH